MAKKSSKSTRRARAKKEQVSKKTAAEAVAPIVAIEAAPEKPKAKTTKSKVATKKTTAKPKLSREKPIEQAVEAEVERLETVESVRAMVDFQRRSMLIGAASLLAIIIVAITGAVALHVRNAEDVRTAEPMAQNGKTPADPDSLLDSGGSVCNNGSTAPTNTGSTNPNSAGMLLQSVPANTIQTPQSLGSSNDAATLQGAGCF